MIKTAVQQFMLGSVFKNEVSVRKTLAAVKEAGYDSIELCSFMLHPMGLFLRLLTKAAGMPVGGGGHLDWQTLIRESGLGVAALHCDLGSLEKDVKAAAREARSYGTDKIVITGMYRFDYGNESTVRERAQRLNEAGKALKEEGMELLYHNHNCELRRVSGPGEYGQQRKCAYDILVDETDPEYVNFEFDSYWFTEGGADAKQWMTRLGSRMKLWHINDRGTRMSGPAMTPILKSDSMELGTGNVDLEGLLDIAKQSGVEAVILESHRNWIHKSPVESLQVSARWMKEHI